MGAAPMSLSFRGKRAISLMLCVVAALSAAQTSGMMSRFVSADNTITIQLLRAATSTESLSAIGTAEINPDNGHLKLELHHATSDSIYTALFVSTSANLQVGVFTTDAGGEGNVQATMGSGAYVGIFQVTRLALTQFESAATTFTIRATASASASASATLSTGSTAESQNTTPTNSSELFVFKVEPASKSISAGEFAKFKIHITQNTTAKIFLVARDVPPGSFAIFTPMVGVANPEFNSTLTILTSANTPAGIYAVTIVAFVNEQEFTSEVALQVSTPSATTTNQNATTTISVAASLSLIISTNQSQYSPNATVIIRGHVTDNKGGATADANVSIQVDSPTGEEVFFAGNVQSDAAGAFHTQFTLPVNATLGTYTVFTSATKAGFSSVTARMTFVVGSSTTPSVVISTVYAGDSAGNPQSTFSVGQTIWIWVVVENSGSTFQGVIWVQVQDPKGVPVEIRINIANLHAGETVKEGIGFTLQGNPTLGVYRVDTLVSDKLISQGGTFLANAQAQFALTG